MTSLSFLRLAAAAFLLLVSISFLAADPQPAAAADQPGDLWEVTSKMSMEGMPMELPATKLKVCSAKVWTEPPGMDQRQKCTTSDFTTTEVGVTWKMTCEGPPAMTGEGEITRQGADAYTGAIKFASADGNMTIKLNGRRVGGCDNPS